LTTTRGKLLRYYADGNSCLIFGQDSPNKPTYNHSATPDVLDIVITIILSSSVVLTSCSTLSSEHLPVLIETGYRSSFQHPPDRPDVRRTDWANFQTQLEAEILLIPELHNGKDIDTCVGNFSCAILGALAASTPKRLPHGDSHTQIPAGIQYEIRLKKWVRRRWQVTREPALIAEVNRLQSSVTRRLNEWRNAQWSTALKSPNTEDQSLWRMTKRVMRIPTPSRPLITPGGLALSDAEKTEARADSLEVQFQPVTAPSVPADIEMVYVEMESYFQDPCKRIYVDQH
jgi:hypothetical protein